MDAEVEDRTYTFDELSPKAKEKAREARRSTELDYDWWQYTYEDAVRIGALMGFEVGIRYERGPRRIDEYQSPDIWFSGFSSQGDGCCWSGWLDVAKLAGSVKRIKGEVGTDDALVDLAKMGEELFAEFASIAAFNRLCSDEDNRDWPEVTTTMRLSVEGHERSYSTAIDDNNGDLPSELQTQASKLVEYFADWIYDQLEQEHDHRLDDVQIDEGIHANDMTFDEDGNAL